MRLIIILFLTSFNAIGADIFENEVRPLLVKHCYECHSSKADRIKGDVILDSKDGITKILNSDELDKSLLLKVLTSGDMPPKKKMGSGEIASIVSWIQSGAKLPENFASIDSRWGQKVASHWAYQTNISTFIPNNKQVNPIDNFVLDKLKKLKLTLSPESNKRELIRRLYFDMTGLPPSPEKVREFENGSKSWEVIVDEVLASKAYGERWARHWLDVARYSDYKGGANNNREDPRYIYAWTYRDYVIDSLNNDKPFDLFIREQLAADLLPIEKRSPNAMAGLAFITIGRRDNNNNDLIDDRIDVITKGFLGLTVTCARCHDHKFDPITQADYYALHGVLRSINEPNELSLPVIYNTTNSPAFTDYLKNRNQTLYDIALYKTNAFQKWQAHFQLGAGSYIFFAHNLANEVPRSDRNQYLRTNSVLKVTGLVGGMVQNWNREMNSNDPFWNPYRELIKEKPENWNTLFNTTFKDSSKYDQTVVRQLQIAKVTSGKMVASIYGGFFNAAVENHLYKKPLANGIQKKAIEIVTKKNGPCDLGNADNFYRILNNQERTQFENGLRNVTAKFIDLEWNSSVTPYRAMVVEESSPVTSKIFILGNAGKLGAPAPRGFIKYLDADGKPFASNNSGRLELAESIIENPLSSRTIVNRIWMHHFGHGFIDTPDDLGVQAGNPTYPELLEYLAKYLQNNGWSLKTLHRIILTSKTYKQDSKPDGRAESKDPSNQYLHRQNIRRLEFEAIRDSIFFFVNDGKFDKQYGGPVDLFRAPYANARTIFGVIDRRRLPETLSNFDVANPNLPTGKRFDTTIPQQSLFMLNGDMILSKAKEIAAKINKNSEDKVTQLYQIVYQRNPTTQELQLINKFLETTTGEKMTPFEQLVQITLLSNEAMYIR